MTSLALQLKNDQIIYDCLNRSGALSGDQVPPLKQLMQMSNLDADTVQHTLERFCQQRL